MKQRETARRRVCVCVCARPRCAFCTGLKEEGEEEEKRSDGGRDKKDGEKRGKRGACEGNGTRNGKKGGRREVMRGETVSIMGEEQ